MIDKASDTTKDIGIHPTEIGIWYWLTKTRVTMLDLRVIIDYRPHKLTNLGKTA